MGEHQHDEILRLREECEWLRKQMLLLDRIAIGECKPGGNEPEAICQIVERFVVIRSERDSLRADLREALRLLREAWVPQRPYADASAFQDARANIVEKHKELLRG